MNRKLKFRITHWIQSGIRFANVLIFFPFKTIWFHVLVVQKCTKKRDVWYFFFMLSRRSRRRSFVRCLLWSKEAKNVTVALEKHSKAYFVIYIFSRMFFDRDFIVEKCALHWFNWTLCCDVNTKGILYLNYRTYNGIWRGNPCPPTICFQFRSRTMKRSR